MNRVPHVPAFLPPVTALPHIFLRKTGGATVPLSGTDTAPQPLEHRQMDAHAPSAPLSVRGGKRPYSLLSCSRGTGAMGGRHGQSCHHPDSAARPERADGPRLVRPREPRGMDGPQTEAARGYRMGGSAAGGRRTGFTRPLRPF